MGLTSFQESSGLPRTGIVDAATWERLLVVVDTGTRCRLAVGGLTWLEIDRSV